MQAFEGSSLADDQGLGDRPSPLDQGEGFSVGGGELQGGVDPEAPVHRRDQLRG